MDKLEPAGIPGAAYRWPLFRHLLATLLSIFAAYQYYRFAATTNGLWAFAFALIAFLGACAEYDQLTAPRLLNDHDEGAPPSYQHNARIRRIANLLMRLLGAVLLILTLGLPGRSAAWPLIGAIVAFAKASK